MKIKYIRQYNATIKIVSTNYMNIWRNREGHMYPTVDEEHDLNV